MALISSDPAINGVALVGIARRIPTPLYFYRKFRTSPLVLEPSNNSSLKKLRLLLNPYLSVWSKEQQGQRKNDDNSNDQASPGS
jgi:hypothetical protein